MITMNDLLGLLTNPDRIRIFKGDEEVFTGFVAYVNGTFPGEDLQSIGLTGEEPVKKYRAVPEIRHKEWKERGLMEPMMPAEMEEYSFSDLMMSLYHVITI